MQPTYYVVLGVAGDESAAGIHAAYRELAKKYHPDVSGDAGPPRFQEIAEAYRVLSDPQSRRRYDGRLRSARPGGARPPSAASAAVRARAGPLRGPASVLGDPEATRPSFEAMLERFRRNFTGAGVPKSERLEGLNFDLVLTPEEAARGGWLEVGVPAFAACPECGGSGYAWLFPCARCGQQGVVESERLVRIDVPPLTPSGSIVEVPLGGLGVHNFYLRLHVVVGG